jgi:phenylacetate-CoA ligase
VPFYRDALLDSGVVVPGQWPRVDLARFTRLPFLSRPTIRKEADRLHDRRPPSPGNPRFARRSGGTTGDPLWLVQDRVCHEHAGAVTLWFDEWSGHDLGRPKVVLWELGPRSPIRALTERLGRFLKNETLLPINTLSRTTMDRYLRRINRRRPSQILGFAGAVRQLARRAEVTGTAVWPPRAVMVSAEALPDDMRETVTRVFGGPVLNRYGAVEVGGIACECRHGRGLHVSVLTHHVEVVRPDGSPCGPGEVGEIAVTLLSNYSMPLIRYRIGDLAAPSDDPEPCPCGRSLPRLTAVVGRVLDSFVRSDGAWVHGVNVKRFYHSVPWIEQFQVVQLATDRILVKLIDRDRRPDALRARQADLQGITEYLRGLMGVDCQVIFDFVEAIPRAASGKYRLTMRLGPDPSDATVREGAPT